MLQKYQQAEDALISSIRLLNLTEQEVSSSNKKSAASSSSDQKETKKKG